MTEKQETDLLVAADDAYFVADYVQAIKLYEQVLNLNPDNQRAILQLEKAQLHLVSQSESVPRQALQYYRMARSHIGYQDYDQAIKLLEKAVAIAQEAGVTYTEAEQLLWSLIDTLEFRKWKVFISYSRNDIDVAKSIYQFLHDNRCNVWMDIYDLVPGQDWELEIQNNIKSSDFFIACLSNNSVSKRGYVQKELKEAISVLEKMPEGEIYIIPIRIDNCLVPSSLADKQWLDWFASDAKEKLLRALKSRM